MADIAVTSHATAMDRMYRHARHIYDLTRKPYLLGRDRLIAELGSIPVAASSNWAAARGEI
jgi:S-adenosylmethionine-diacylgycerolhomoserine-N-methlytransferase